MLGHLVYSRHADGDEARHTLAQTTWLQRILRALFRRH